MEMSGALKMATSSSWMGKKNVLLALAYVLALVLLVVVAVVNVAKRSEDGGH